MRPELKQRLTEYFNELTLDDIYEIKLQPCLLYRTGKNKHRLSVFSSADSYEKHKEIFFKNLDKKRLSLMTKELQALGYKVEKI